jgi:hypothetical protein
MALKGKDYYLALIYPMLYAAGGVFWEKLAEPRPRLRWLRVALPAVVFAGPGCRTAGSPGSSASQDCSLHGRARHQANSDGNPDARPFAAILRRRIRWPEMVETVAGVYNSLPPEERAKTAILAHNYGGAGAIDFFGPRYGLPKSISPHQNYYHWGPRQYTDESLILLWISMMPSAGVAVWIRGQPSLRITAWSGSTMPS